jgi:hypothetical protein
MEAIEEKGTMDSEGVVRVELEYSVSELRQLISHLPSRHPLVSKLKRQLNECVNKHEGELFSTESRFTYLTEKLKVSSMEQLLSKALSFINWGIELEERGYEVQAVKRNFFTKEVLKFKIGGN